MRYRYERGTGYDAIIIESEDKLDPGSWPRGKLRIVLKPTNFSKRGAVQMVLNGIKTGSTKQSKGRTVDAALRDAVKKPG